MTSINLMLIGAQAWASVDGPLTSGMVGIPVTIEYDQAWDGLTKNLMCRCSPWGSNEGNIRTILNVEENATVAHEVMQAGMYLKEQFQSLESEYPGLKLIENPDYDTCNNISSLYAARDHIVNVFILIGFIQQRPHLQNADVGVVSPILRAGIIAPGVMACGGYPAKR